jgi:hypothetical protein
MRVENISPDQIKVDRFTVEGFCAIDVPDDLYLLFQSEFQAYVDVGILALPLNKQVSGLQNATIEDYGEIVQDLGLVTFQAFLDLSKGNVITAEVSGSFMWNLPTVINSGICKSFTLILKNGGTGVQTFNPTPKWPGGTAPTLTVSGIDVLCFFYDPIAGVWRGVLSQADSK